MASQSTVIARVVAVAVVVVVSASASAAASAGSAEPVDFSPERWGHLSLLFPQSQILPRPARERFL